MKQIKLHVFSILVFTVVGCSPKTDWLVNPPGPIEQRQQDGGTLTSDFQVDAEFVVIPDNSGSMKVHIETVRKQLGEFVNQFSIDNPLHYNFGVLEISDQFSPNFAKKDYFGDLRQVRGADGKEIPGKYFLSSDDPESERIAMMENTMAVPIVEPKDKGPNFEGLLKPLYDLYSDMGMASPVNQGFFLGKASFKFFIFITDANDESRNTDPLNVATRLWERSDSPDKVSGFGAMVLKGGGCKSDDAGYPKRELELLRLVEGKWANVCKDFGSALADWGKVLRAKTIARTISLNETQRIEITSGKDRDDVRDLRVFYGPDKDDMSKNVFIPRGPGGYRFDPNGNTIVFRDDFKLAAQKDGRLRIKYNLIRSGQGSVAARSTLQAVTSPAAELPLPPNPPIPPVRPAPAR